MSVIPTSADQQQAAASLPEALTALAEARHHDPHTVLGRHEHDGQVLVRAYLPSARTVQLVMGARAMTRVPGSDFFEWRGSSACVPERYELAWVDSVGQRHTAYDPYAFPPHIGDLDLYLFGAGRHWHAYRFLGAHVREVDGIAGVQFAVWAPNAARVSVIGDFNAWDGRRHPLRVRGASGVWELFIPGLNAGSLYKFELRERGSTRLSVKSDPYARRCEHRPKTASIVEPPSNYLWSDAEWLAARRHWDWQHAPMSVYEVHLGSWRRAPLGEFLNYRALADLLVPYLCEQGYTHIELLPVMEHPLDESWGYQCTGYFAPTSRHGAPDDLRYLIDRCHASGIGVLLDWVPAHFPKDAHALARFDGSALYEHEDPRLAEHRDWGTLIFNYGRNEVKNFLLASALYWLEEFHIDGLRVDAVASMLYLDYSREPGQWVPNRHGGNENLEAIAFLRELNQVTHGQCPGTLMIAEESTAWPQVTRPTWGDGLGFSMKWNMGWMHDTLVYMSKDPVHRQHHHNQLTFGLLYAFHENFVLPFSHDEVVHGKGAMLAKMPGDEWQRFANLRLLYTYLYTYPGKKHLFMGAELGQGEEWNHARELPWWLLRYPLHRGVQALTRDLNRLYRELPALHRDDFHPQGFEWIDCRDAHHSVLAYLRRDGAQAVIAVFNFTPVPRSDYRLGVPDAGTYRVVLNSDARLYGGGDAGSCGAPAEPVPWMDRPYSIVLNLPPLAGMILVAAG